MLAVWARVTAAARTPGRAGLLRPPPLGRLDAGGAEHVQDLGAGIGRQLLEVGAHRVLDRPVRLKHVVADFLLLFERVALRRVQAEVRPEERHFLGLGEFGHLGFVRRGSFRQFPYKYRSAPHGFPWKKNPERSAVFCGRVVCRKTRQTTSDLRKRCILG